jgi:F-box interacting protein
MFTFGYDDSTRTYKVVAYHVKGEKKNKASGDSEVKVFSVGDGDNCWRNIQSFPVIPLDWHYEHYTRAKHLNGTINWLAINKYFYSSYVYSYITHVEQFVIVSLDLSTETYKQLLLPQGFDKVPFVQPNLNVLKGCLCFSHDSNKTEEFVLWQMKEYGVQESWTRLFKIRNQNLRMHCSAYIFELVCLYINGYTVILANKYSDNGIIYNLRDQRGKTIKITS